MPSKKVAWIEGKEEAQNIINKLADEIVGAVLPDGETNKWTKVYEIDKYMWVTYQENFRDSTTGYYKHTDGKSYPVYKINDNTGLVKNTGETLIDEDGCVWEVDGSSTNTQTGKKFQVVSISFTDEEEQPRILPVPGLLVVNVDDADDPTGKKCYVVEQKRKELDDSYKIDKQWNEFKILTEMPTDWNYLLTKSNATVPVWGYYSGGSHWYAISMTGAAQYKFKERYYTADATHSIDKTVVLKCMPDVPAGIEATDYFVMFKQPINQYNYFDVSYGEGFEGILATGDQTSTYTKACDVATVFPGLTPTITDQKEAEYVYKSLQSETPVFTPPAWEWIKDYDGVTEMVSPPAHYFFGADATYSWLENKKRRPDYWVRYYISVNNDRIALVIEGDPAPDMESYYRSFGYIGRIIPFNEYDYPSNFAVTVGMGDLAAAKTGFTLDNIKQDKNLVYSGYGPYTSNGMYSVSMLRTASHVLFQAHYPAFITQLPDYPSVGTLPPDLMELILEKDGYQPSSWTKKYHASPVYLLHQTEGYRGYMDGVVAITDHNLVNLDELVVDTEELKDEENPEAGTWTEVYKFFKINTPVNFLKYSANPGNMTIAILKEVK